MSLKLDKGEQKDAQEFSKLFMSLLDHEFKKQGIKAASEGGPNVAALVQEQVRSQSIRVWPIANERSSSLKERSPTAPSALPAPPSPSAIRLFLKWRSILRCVQHFLNSARRGLPFLSGSQKNCNLEARIKESLKDEPMSGDNQCVTSSLSPGSFSP